jgi:hypothetical protein
MKTLLEKLKGGDRRSLGKVNEVVAEVLESPPLFATLFDGMLHADPVVAMRAADAVEKITVKHPEYLRPYKKKIIAQIAMVEQQEVRWHVAQLFSRLEWTAAERRIIVKILYEYLNDKSKIVKTFSMQALAALAAQDKNLLPAIQSKIEEMTRSGSPAMQSRGRKLLAQMKGNKR